MADLFGTRWRERVRWSGTRVIEVTSQTDGSDPEATVSAVVVENSGRPQAAGTALPRPIRVRTLTSKWERTDG